jgi:hypothetical protein
MAIVDEHHAVSDEHFVLDDDALADKRMGRHLAAPADLGTLLDLDEGSDPRAVTDAASVEIDELGVMNDDVGSDHDVG